MHNFLFQGHVWHLALLRLLYSNTEKMKLLNFNHWYKKMKTFLNAKKFFFTFWNIISFKHTVNQVLILFYLEYRAVFVKSKKKTKKPFFSKSQNFKKKLIFQLQQALQKKLKVQKWWKTHQKMHLIPLFHLNIIIELCDF